MLESEKVKEESELDRLIIEGETIKAYKMMKEGCVISERTLDLAGDNCQKGSPERNGEFGVLYHMVSFHISEEKYKDIYNKETKEILDDYEVYDEWYLAILEVRMDTYKRYKRNRREYLEMSGEEQLEILEESIRKVKKLSEKNELKV